MVGESEHGQVECDGVVLFVALTHEEEIALAVLKEKNVTGFFSAHLWPHYWAHFQVLPAPLHIVTHVQEGRVVILFPAKRFPERAITPKLEAAYLLT